MRDHSNHITGSRHEVVGALLSRWTFDRAVERVPVAQAAGRVCARTVRSLTTLPNARTSNMDAVAVRFSDFEHGRPDTGGWTRGVEWQFCNTGVAVPEGFDTAIPIEQVEVSPDNERLAIREGGEPRERYACTSEPGSTLREGDLLVRAGEVLTPVLLSVLNMGGFSEVDVVKKPRVAFIPTGNELVDAGVELPSGKNIESNAAMICARIAAWGGEPVRFDIVPDRPDAILAALREACATCDVVAINAGSSKGSDDWTCEILEREGELLYHQVSQAPGKHCSFSLLDGTPVIGVSGPPIGAEFTADFFIKPFVDAYLGASLDWPPTLRARALDANPMSPRGSDVCVRVTVRRTRDERFVFWRTALPERPALRFTNDANGVAIVDRDAYGWQEGDLVEIELRFPYALPPYLEE